MIGAPRRRAGPHAAALGAVNCVVRDGDRLLGTNTDGAGFVDALTAASVDLGRDPACWCSGPVGRRGPSSGRLVDAGVAEVGGGQPLRRTGPRPRSRSGGRAAPPRPMRPDAPDYDVVVNATSVGMGARRGRRASCPLDRGPPARRPRRGRSRVRARSTTGLLAAARDGGRPQPWTGWACSCTRPPTPSPSGPGWRPRCADDGPGRPDEASRRRNPELQAGTVPMVKEYRSIRRKFTWRYRARSTRSRSPRSSGCWQPAARPACSDSRAAAAPAASGSTAGKVDGDHGRPRPPGRDPRRGHVRAPALRGRRLRLRQRRARRRGGEPPSSRGSWMPPRPCSTEWRDIERVVPDHPGHGDACDVSCPEATSSSTSSGGELVATIGGGVTVATLGESWTSASCP